MQQIRHLTAEDNHAIHMMHTKNITENNALIYVRVKVITRYTSTQKRSEQNSEFHTTMEKKAWKKIKKLRKDTSTMLGKESERLQFQIVHFPLNVFPPPIAIFIPYF